MTEVRGAEARLRRSEERFRTGIEDGPLAIVLVDEDGRISDANTAVSRLLGLPRSELLGA